MKVRKLRDGELIEVGDRIKCEHRGYGVDWRTVTRVTPKFAFTRNNEHAETKYQREANTFWFQSIPRQKWSMTDYSAWRPVKEEA